MSDNNLDLLAARVFDSVKTYCAKREADLLDLFQKAEAAMAQRHAQSLEGLALIVEKAVSAALAAIPAPPKGDPGDPGPKGDPGESIDKDALLLSVKETIAEQVRALPPAPPGAPGKDADPALAIEAALAALPSLAAKMKEELSQSLSASLEALVAQIPIPKDGASVLIGDVQPMILAAVQAEVAAIPKPANGKDADPVDLAAVHRFVVEVVDAQIKNIVVPEGKPGTSVTLEDVAPAIGAEVRKQLAETALPELHGALSLAVAQIPKPADGKSVTLEEIAPLIDAAAEKRAPSMEQLDHIVEAALARASASAPPQAPPPEIDYALVFKKVMEQVDAAVALIPVPANGKDADPAVIASMVEDAVKQIEIVVPDPIPGKDGVSVDAEQVRSMVRGEVAQAILALPKEKAPDLDAIKLMVDLAVTHYLKSMPPPPAGKDGLSVKDFKLELLPDDRTLRMSLNSNGEVEETNVQEVVLPMVISRDAYEQGKLYARGDSVAWDGSWWIAKRSTNEVPGTSDSWKLAAQRGRPGKDREVAVKGKEATQVRLK